MTTDACRPGCARCLSGLCHGCHGCDGEGGHRVAPRQLAGRWIGIVGSRHHGNPAQLDRVLAALPPPSEAVLVSGGCPTDDPGNIDQRVKDHAAARGYRLVELEADWNRWGKRAGPLRNEEIVETVDEFVALPWFDSRGTKDILGRAERHGIPARKIRPKAAQLTVWTARLDPRLDDPDLLDITRATAIDHDKARSEAWKQRWKRKDWKVPESGEMGALAEEARKRARLGYGLREVQRTGRASGWPSIGAPFAPSWPLVQTAKRGLQAAAQAAAAPPDAELDGLDEAERIAEEVWRAYLDGWDGEEGYGAVGFARELHDNCRRYRAILGWVLAQRRIVLGCFCARPTWWRPRTWDRCHRFVVARAFEACGAQYAGELAPPAERTLFGA